MPRFRFVAADATGSTHEGTIDAATEDVARNKLASNGLAVRSVTEATSADGAAAPEMPRPAAPRFGGPQLVPIPVRPPGFDGSNATERGGGGSSPFPIVFSLLALIVSLGTAAYTLSRDPLASRAGKYDFSSGPEEAYRSSLKMMANGDLLARLERENKLQAPQAREILNTLEFSYPHGEYRGKKALFVKFQWKGKTRQQVRWFELDQTTGTWRRSHAMDTEIAINGLPPHLSERITNWVTPDQDDGFGPEADW